MPAKPKFENQRSGGGRPRREGAILGLVLIVMVVLSILAVGVMRLSDTGAVEAARAGTDARAFWLAEAGLHHARSLMGKDTNYLYQTSWSQAGTGMTYAFTVVSNGVTPDGDGQYQITSTGTAASASRAVRQTLSAKVWWPAFDYALYGAGGSMDVWKLSIIQGSVFEYGDVNLGTGCVITQGEVFATGSVTPGYPVGDLPDTMPPMPQLDTAYYGGLIATAAVSSLTWGVAHDTNLAGRTVFINGNASLGNITGTGTLVVAGNVTMSKDLWISNSVTIIAGGTFTIDKGLTANANCELYAGAGFTLNKDGLLLDNCSLITPAGIQADKSFTCSGLLYAGGTIVLKKDATLTGAAVAGGGFDIRQNLNVSYDPTQFMNSLTQLGFIPQIVLGNILWEQL
jgi:hypothetical protein